MSFVDYFTRVQASSGWARILTSFTRFVSPQPGQRALDVGCGPGALTRRLAQLGCEAHGVDAEPAMIAQAAELARAQPGAHFRVGGALSLPFADSEFDLVTATNVIFLIPDPAAGLEEMTRVCRSGGIVAMLNPSPKLSRASAQAYAEALGLTDFNAFSLTNWGTVAESNHRFTPETIEALFTQAGLQTLEIVEKAGPGLALFAKAQK